jgi:hypothetical protein
MARKSGPDTRFYDLSGGINKNASDLKLRQTSSRTEWWDAENVEFYRMGGISKMKGNQIKITFPVGSTVLGIWEYKKGAKNDEAGERIPIAVYSDGVEGHLVKLDLVNGTYTELCGGFDPVNKPNFENYLDGVVVTDGKTKMVIYQDWEPEKSRVKEINIKGQRGTVPTDICEYSGRLFACKNDKLMYCSPGDPHDWSTASVAGEIKSFHGSGNNITALRTYGENMAIYREDYDTSVMVGSSPDEFIIKPFIDKGAVSPHSIVNFANKQFFYNDGIFALEYSSLHQLQLTKEYSLLIHPAFEELDKDRFNEIVAVAYPLKRQVWFYFPTLDDEPGELGVCWILDLTGGGNNIAWYKRVMNPILCACKMTDRVYTGVDNTIRLEDATAFAGGESFSAFWWSPWFDFGSINLKSAEDVKVVFAADRSSGIDVVFRYDTITTREKVKSYTNIGESSFFVFGQSLFGEAYKFPANKAVIKTVSVPNLFTTLQIGFRTDEDFAIHGFEFEELFPED